MKLYHIILLAVVFLFTSCFEQATTPTPSTIAATGGLSLNFDKTQTPEGVAIIRAVLKRNTDSLVSKISIMDSNKAEIFFSSVAIGTWRLKIDALNSSDALLYTGTADVTVQSNSTTVVNLVLEPVSSGTGSVRINISWGGTTSSSLFKDYANNPVLKYHYQDSTKYQVSQPIVTYYDGKYRLWYMALLPTVAIGYVTSSDGINWTQESEKPVIVPEPNNRYETDGVWPGGVIVENGLYQMYFNSISGNQNIVNIAVSKDGKTWERKAANILPSTSSESNVGVTGAAKVNGTYYLYYHYINSRTGLRCIGLATSSDGTTFTRYTANPVLAKTFDWEMGGIYYPSVIYDNEQFKMVYQSLNSYWPKEAIGYAVSSDGKNWTKKSISPAFTINETAKLWAGVNIGYPTYVKTNNEYRIYYYGYNPNNVIQRQIGFAVQK